MVSNADNIDDIIDSSLHIQANQPHNNLNDDEYFKLMNGKNNVRSREFNR